MACGCHAAPRCFGQVRPAVDVGDELLLACRRSLGAEQRAAFAHAHGAEPEDLEGFLAGFLGEGVLQRGA